MANDNWLYDNFRNQAKTNVAAGDPTNIPDPNYNESVAAAYAQKHYHHMHPAYKDVEDRTGDSPAVAALRQALPFAPRPSIPDQSNSSLANALGIQEINNWPTTWDNRWGAQFLPSISDTHNLIENLYNPLQERAAQMRYQNKWSTPAGTPSVYDRMLIQALRDKS